MIDERISRRRALSLFAGVAALTWTGRRIPQAVDPKAGQAGQGRSTTGVSGGTMQPQDSLLGRLMDPAAGGMRQPVTQYENDPFVVGIEQKLRCTCGCNLSVYTCRTTDFTCTVSPQMHAHVVELVKEGKSAQDILDAFVSQYGQSVLMAPPREGFNLLGYLVPGVLITLVGAALAWVLVRRTRGGASAAGAGPGSTPGGDSMLPPDDAARLRAELERLEP